MGRNMNRENGFDDFYWFGMNHFDDGIYTLIYEDRTIKCQLYTAYNSDNDLELDDPDYKEFEAMAFKDLEDGTLFEVTYCTLPIKALYNGQEFFPNIKNYKE